MILDKNHDTIPPLRGGKEGLTGVLLINLGTPDDASVKSVRKYLTQFLNDPRVIDINPVGRFILVNGIIVPFRAPKSAEAYKTIWTEQGSPLIVLTKELQQSLQQKLEEPVTIAMRYGSPSPKEAFDLLLKKNPDLKEVILVPLYPHFAMSSYETAVDYAKEQYAANNYSFKISFIKPFYREPDYINALAENMKPWLAKDHDHILFSYHGIPERHIRKSDTTGCHCLQVTNCCDTDSPAHATCYRH